MRHRGLCALLVLSGLLSGCGGLVDPSKNTLETISGTLTAGGSDSRTFTVPKNGEFTITLTAVSPAPVLTGYLGVALGVPDTGGNCQPVQRNNFVRVGTQALGSTITAAVYCVGIFDVGYLVANTTYSYTMQFSHP